MTHLVNLSIKSGLFPDQWKKAVVISILKLGDTEQVCNYCPISILPALSKVLEKVVTEQLADHLQSNQLLHPEQFGFRHKHSTATATCLFFREDEVFYGWGKCCGGSVPRPEEGV